MTGEWYASARRYFAIRRITRIERAVICGFCHAQHGICRCVILSSFRRADAWNQRPKCQDSGASCDGHAKSLMRDSLPPTYFCPTTEEESPPMIHNPFEAAQSMDYPSTNVSATRDGYVPMPIVFLQRYRSVTFSRHNLYSGSGLAGRQLL